MPALDQCELCRIGVPVGQGDQHGGLPVAQVVQDGLAGDRGIAEHTEQVVAQLEGFADGYPVGAVPLLHGRTGAGENPAELQRPLDRVPGGLVPDDP